MAKPTLTLTLEGEAAERLAALAEASGRTVEWYADFMIREYAGEEMRIVADLRERLESIKRGNGIPHEEVMRETTALIEAAAAARSPGKKGRAASR